MPNNIAREFVELKTFYGRVQMKLHKTMVERNDYPRNDCQLFVNLGNIVHGLADDYERCESVSGKLAISEKALEIVDEMCRVYDGVAIRNYVDSAYKAEERG